VDATSVSALYDALFDFESRRRGDGAYPVHKQLRFPEGRYVDVYDWIADRLRLRSADRVLDVGCGVGFGTIRLAERGVAHATGITISRQELSRARRASARSTRSGNVDFVRGSFDQLPREAFDVVVAVESLKHSADLRITLRAILDSMVPGGRAVLVEDVFVGDPARSDARRVVGDWLLARLYTEADYVMGLGGGGCRVVDLTPAVRRRGRVLLAAQRGALNAVWVWPGATRGAALRAFRGGLHLERLYAAGAMRYKAFFFSKDGTEPR
jgi:SAM-dependent methyltransferase